MDARAASSTFGDRRKPAILFLHGIRLGRAVWNASAAALGRRYHVVTLDLPGHGALAGVPFTEENVTALLTDAIENVAGAPALIVGYSLGGFVALRYASRFPERTRGLLLAGCSFDFDWRWWPYDVSIRLSETLPDAWRRALLHALLSITLPRGWLDVVEPIPFDRDVFKRTSAIVRSSAHAIDEARSYRKPVLVVNGEYDFIFRLDERRLLHRLPQARLRLIRGGYHTAPLRRMDEFTSIVDGFARRVFDSVQPTR